MPRNKYQTVTVLPPASQFGRGESVIYQGEVLTSDGTNWTSQTGPLTYTAETLPDPATLGAGATVVVEDINGNSTLLTSSGDSFSSDYTPRKTKLAAWMPNIIGFVNTSNTVTYGACITSNFGDFESVALILQNLHTADVTMQAIVAPTDSLANSYTIPTVNGTQYTGIVADGSQNGFTRVTSNGSTSIVIPANSELFVTDFMPIGSLARVDNANKNPALIVRANWNAQQSSAYQFSSLSEVQAFASNTLVNGDFHQFLTYTDRVTDPTGWTQPATEINQMYIKGVIFRTKNNVAANIMFIGDSIDHGLGNGGDTVTNNAGNTIGWTGLSCKELQEGGTNVGIISAGWSGKTSANFFARAKTLAALLKPTIAVFPAYTPNDSTGTYSGVETAINRAIDFIEYCYQNNIIPVVRTPVPYTGSGAESLRMSVVNKVKSMGVLVIDANAPLYDSAASAQGYWKSASYTVDGTHPSKAGNDLMAEQASQLWKMIL